VSTAHTQTVVCNRSKVIKYLVIILSIVVASCKSETSKSSNRPGEKSNAAEEQVIDSSQMLNVIERYFPREHEVTTFDTIVSDKDVRIRIVRSSIETYVLNEFSSRVDHYKDKYRDNKILLEVKNKDSIILDTMFLKMQFLDMTNQEFMNESIYHNFWFEETTEDLAIFHGSISKLETDWALDLWYELNISTGDLELTKWRFE
jgi:hypothetical protein